MRGSCRCFVEQAVRAPVVIFPESMGNGGFNRNGMLYRILSVQQETIPFARRIFSDTARHPVMLSMSWCDQKMCHGNGAVLFDHAFMLHQ